MAGKRRSRSEWGTVHKRRNRFTVEFTGPDGARHTAGRSFHDKTSARGWLAEERKKIDNGTWTPPKQRKAKEQHASLTVGQWLDKFHDLLEQRPVPPRRSTMQNYRRVTRVRITEPCGAGAKNSDVNHLRNVRLADLSKVDVYRWWDGVQSSYKDHKTVNQQAFKRLRAACAEAVNREIIPSNPVSIPGVGKRLETKEKYLPTDKELEAILQAVGEPYRALTSLVLHHGLRIGEAIALEVADVHVEKTPSPWRPKVTVTVKRNAQRISENGSVHMELQPPKSKAGYREVPIMGVDVPIFLNHMAKFAAQTPMAVPTWQGVRKVRLFTVTQKGKIVMDTSYRSVLGRARKRAGVSEEIDPHCGRNWLITRLAEKGAHPKEIGELLGQEDVSTILDVYLKVRAGRTNTLMDKVNSSLCVI